MIGPSYPWLLVPIRASRARATRLAQAGRRTLAIGVLGLLCTLGPAMQDLPALATVASTPPVVSLEKPETPDWTQVLGRVWALAPFLFQHTP